jgi:hypothetical protein
MAERDYVRVDIEAAADVIDDRLALLADLHLHEVIKIGPYNQGDFKYQRFDAPHERNFQTILRFSRAFHNSQYLLGLEKDVL